MPTAAAPQYLLQQDSRGASPGLRFGLLLPIWTQRRDQEAELNQRAGARSREADDLRRMIQSRGIDAAIDELVRDDRLPGLWEKNDAGARQAWDYVATLTTSDKQRTAALVRRQEGLVKALPEAAVLAIPAEAVAPFTTGLGNEHPLENGFAFLNPYGIPYLPGSGVKGVVRRAAEELAAGEAGASGWSNEPEFETKIEEEVPDEGTGKLRKEKVKLSRIDVLFGRETPEHRTGHVRGVLTFWDVIPDVAGDRLLVEIMTPHYTHYYQQRDKPDGGSCSPHDSGQPNPISFLTVPPGSKFYFVVTCDVIRLRALAPVLEKEGLWKKLLEEAFQHAFTWLGFGAKTAVGYGAMKELQAPAESTQVPGPAPPAAAIEWRGASLNFNPGQQSVTATYRNQRTAPLTGEALKRFFEQLGPKRAQELRERRRLENVALAVEQEGRMFKIVGLLEN